MAEQVTTREFQEAEGVEDWRLLSEGACAFFRTETVASGARFVAAISGIAGLDEHDFGIDVRSAGVTVRLVTVTDDYFGITGRDVELARRVSAVARELGLPADPSRLQSLLIIPGAADRAGVMPFWRALLG
jgi:4a-hydroxytetrahydrobiopterin dehydratase